MIIRHIISTPLLGPHAKVVKVIGQDHIANKEVHIEDIVRVPLLREHMVIVEVLLLLALLRGISA